MTRSYAENTKVTVESSRAELHRTLKRYGATETLIHERPEQLRVGFVLRGYKIAVPFRLPARGDFRSDAAYDREVRRRWRVLLLLLKGRMEMVEQEVEAVPEAFLPYLLLPDGVTTVGEQAIPAVEDAYREGRMPASLLPGVGGGKVIALPARTSQGGR